MIDKSQNIFNLNTGELTIVCPYCKEGKGHTPFVAVSNKKIEVTCSKCHNVFEYGETNYVT